MKRLFLTLGLVIAFLISVNSAHAALGSIFDIASYQTPEFKSLTLGNCSVLEGDSLVDASYCDSAIKALNPTLTPYQCDGYTSASYDETIGENGSFTISLLKKYCAGSGETGIVQSIMLGTWTFDRTDNFPICPPDGFPLYILGVDSNSDGKDDKCFNPDELDNLSNCANNVGSMLPAVTNLSNKVCKTDQVTGASCGYSKKDGDVVYKADLEMNCFGDGEKVPEYDPEPMPQPDKCAKYNDQLMVCKADPKEKCDALGNCGDQCGFVNKELFCFIECTGADCDKETPPPPVNCETNPTAPVCVDEPVPPEFCEANPTDPKCTVEPPEPCSGDDCGSTGSGGQKVDLKPVVDQLKDINSKLDFSTEKGEGRKKFGAFDDLFGDADLLEIKNITTEKKDEATQLINNIKDEFSGLFKVSSVGGSYDDLTLDFSYGSYHSKVWEFFQQNVSIIASAIMALAWLLAASIVMGGRND